MLDIWCKFWWEMISQKPTFHLWFVATSGEVNIQGGLLVGPYGYDRNIIFIYASVDVA